MWLFALQLYTATTKTRHLNVDKMTLNLPTQMRQLVLWDIIMLFQSVWLFHTFPSALHTTITYCDTKWFQRYYEAQVLIINYLFNFFIILYTTETHILVEIIQITTK